MKKDDARLMVEVAELTLRSMNGTLNETELRRLESLMEREPHAIEYYLEILWTHVGLNFLAGISALQEFDTDQFDRDFWNAMLHEEKNAPAIEIFQERQPCERIQNVVYPPKEKRKISRLSVFYLMLNAAAVIFIVLFVKFAPPKRNFEVAFLSDSIDAKWADMGVSMPIGTRLVANRDKLLLREGLAEITFDNHAKAVIEAPAEFQILAEDRIGLTYGKVYTIVPHSAIGFSVYTLITKIVDIGTEFGVEVGFDGTTELHVIDGKTMLISRVKGQESNIPVIQGAAKRIFGTDGSISDISCDRLKFARMICSDRQRIWRGENISLVSLVAGLDGFQDVEGMVSLNPETGQMGRSVVGRDRTSGRAYSVVPESPFIDGVFVPDGREGAIQITSAGHVFNAPRTSGVYTHEIAAYRGAPEHHATIPPAVFNGRMVTHDAILMLHSNIGITFDLQAIRDSLPGLNLNSFKAWGGITETLNHLQSERPDVDIWILVDGQIRYEKEKLVIENGPISFDIEIDSAERFLTLIVTDGLRAPHDNRWYPFGSDFFYLINPELSLTDRSDR